MRRLALLSVYAIWSIPLMALILASLTPHELIVAHRPFLKFTTANYRDLLADGTVISALLNSVVSASSATAIAVLAAAPAAYAAARQDVTLRGVFGWILTTRILPPAAILVPLFVAVQATGLHDSLLGLSTVVAAANVPLMAWLLRQFIAEIPRNVLDAVTLDGGSDWQLIRWIVLPLAGPGIVAAVLLTFVFAWNDYFFAAVLVSSPDLKTLPVLTADFVTGYQIRWGLMLACDVVLITPPILLALFATPRLTRVLLPRTSR